MKKLNLRLFSILVLLLCFLPVQTILAGEDVPLKADDGLSTFDPHSPRAPVRIALEVTQNETDITLDFLYPVGAAQVTVTNENGDVVYQEAVDTYTTLDTYVDTQSLDGGVYTLKISYGSTNLIGEFEL
jgi:hypothetical protein